MIGYINSILLSILYNLAQRPKNNIEYESNPNARITSLQENDSLVGNTITMVDQTLGLKINHY